MGKDWQRWAKIGNDGQRWAIMGNDSYGDAIIDKVHDKIGVSSIMRSLTRAVIQLNKQISLGPVNSIQIVTGDLE